jgi:HEAT repeat protein
MVLAAAPLLAACAQPSRTASFESGDPAARLRAVQNAAQTGDRHALPGLINMLASDDSAERLLAIRTLEHLTGKTLGYDHAAPPQQRREAMDRWAAWYAAGGRIHIGRSPNNLPKHPSVQTGGQRGVNSGEQRS